MSCHGTSAHFVVLQFVHISKKVRGRDTNFLMQLWISRALCGLAIRDSFIRIKNFVTETQTNLWNSCKLLPISASHTTLGEAHIYVSTFIRRPKIGGKKLRTRNLSALMHSEIPFELFVDFLKNID